MQGQVRTSYAVWAAVTSLVCVSLRLFTSSLTLPSRKTSILVAMEGGASRDRRRIWFVVVGAVVGVAVGILVSVTTDVPLAPEAGLLLGALVGWLSR
jgi:hypothetical protein